MIKIMDVSHQELRYIQFLAQVRKWKMKEKEFWYNF